MTEAVSILDTLIAHAATNPDAPCLLHLESGRSVSYGQMVHATQRLTTMLAEAQVGRRSRVVFAVRNHWLVFPLLAACAERRAVLCPIDPDSHRDELAFILADAAPVLSIFPARITVPNVPGRGQLVTLDAFMHDLDSAAASAASSSAATVEGASASDTSLMIYTSGTTGGSKCVMLSSANLLANAASLIRRYGVTAADRFFCVLPTHHMNALMMTGMVPLCAGGSVVLSDVLSFKNAKHYWRLLATHDATIFSVVPSIMALLLRLSPDGSRPKLPSMRFGFCGAAPLAADLWQRFEATFACIIHQGYGLTETTCWAVSTVPGREHRHDAVGVPLDCADVRIDRSPFNDDEALLFDDGAALRSESDASAGEVLLRGPIVGPGYFKNARLTSDSMTPDGYFRTGDLGTLDADGTLRITGRLKEVIIRNGSNVFSRDVDAVLRAHPRVRDSKTIGVRDELVGERVVSVCVVDDDGDAPITTNDLRRFCQERLSQAQWPDAVHRMGYLPAGAAGKVSMNTLRKIIGGELAEEILTSLQSWRFKRAHPSDAEAIRTIVQRALVEGRDIPFLAYWGCGERDELADCDRQALVRLRDYVQGARRVPQASPTMTLVFTDMHARNNRIPEARMDTYFAAIRNEAEALGMRCEFLSGIWSAAGLEVSAIRSAIASPEFAERWAAEPMAAQLVTQASRHVEAGGDPNEAARFYYQACALEGAAIASRYPGHVFATYNPPEADCVSPPLPKVYLHSFKEGTSVKPWFTS